MPAPDPPPPTAPGEDLLADLTAPPPAARLEALLAEVGLRPASAAAVAVAVLLAVAAWWWLRAPAATSAEATLPLTPAASSVPAAPTGSAAVPVTPTLAAGGEVVAHAAGAVVRPGLYRLPAGARIDDLLRAAGGAGPRADLDRVNLAAPVVDGSQVLVPRVGEPVPAGGAGTTGTGTGAGPGPAGPVDLNTADATTLETLPGVGPATAAAILEYREANGGFATVDELIDVPGIGEAKLAAVRDLVVV